MQADRCRADRPGDQRRAGTCQSARLGDHARIEAYRLSGASRPFPPHFHDHYVIGLVEAGERVLLVNGGKETLGAGDVVAFNPGDSHSCAQEGENPLEYRGLNVPSCAIVSAIGRVTGSPRAVRFSTVVRDEGAFAAVRRVHDCVLGASAADELRVAFDGMVSALLPFADVAAERPCVAGEVVARALAYMEEHLSDRISVSDLCSAAQTSESTLLRAFARERGITPYRCLESLRIAAAQRLLEEGAAPVDAALQTGFSDQSHFTNRFREVTGLTPAAYAASFGTSWREADGRREQPGRPAARSDADDHGPRQRGSGCAVRREGDRHGR